MNIFVGGPMRSISQQQQNAAFVHNFQLILFERFSFLAHTRMKKNVQFMSFEHVKSDDKKIFIIPFLCCQCDRPTKYGRISFHREI